MQNFNAFLKLPAVTLVGAIVLVGVILLTMRSTPDATHHSS